jgi:hypothetical protein
MTREFSKPHGEYLWKDEFKSAVLGLAESGIAGEKLQMEGGLFKESGGTNNKIYTQEIIIPDESGDENLESAISITSYEEGGAKFISFSFYLTPALDGQDFPLKVFKYFSEKLPDYILRLDILHNNTRANMLELMRKSIKDDPEGWQKKMEKPLLAFAARSLKGSGYAVTHIRLVNDIELGVLPVVMGVSESRRNAHIVPHVKFEGQIGLAEVEDTLALTKLARGDFSESQ